MNKIHRLINAIHCLEINIWNLIDRFNQNLTADVMHVEIIDSLWLRNRYIVFQVPYIQNGHHSSIIKLLANRDYQLSPVKF